MSKKSLRFSAIIFFLFLIVLPILTTVLPKEYFSENENRTLAKFPKFSLEKIKDKSYMKGVEDFVSDHFVGRLGWIRIKTDVELLTGKREVNDVYIGKDRLLEAIDEPDYEEIDKAINAINKFTNEIDKPVYVMVAPTSAEIYADELPKNAPNLDQKEFIEYIYEGLDDSVIPIDIYMTMNGAKNEYIYYRNDHHWTTLGAYYAYNSSIKKLGFNPISLEQFSVEHASSDFKGTFYSKSLYNKLSSDVLDIYSLPNGSEITSVKVNDGREEKTYDSMYFREFLDKKDKYSTFLGSNQPLVTIDTDVNNEKSILVIKDSYAHSYVPFLTQHYSKVTMLDMRYVNTSYNSVVDIDEYSQVLFLYNASTLTTDQNIKKLGFGS